MKMLMIIFPEVGAYWKILPIRLLLFSVPATISRFYPFATLIRSDPTVSQTCEERRGTLIFAPIVAGLECYDTMTVTAPRPVCVVWPMGVARKGAEGCNPTWSRETLGYLVFYVSVFQKLSVALKCIIVL